MLFGICPGATFTRLVGSTVNSIGSANAAVGTFPPLPPPFAPSRTNGTCASPRTVTAYLPGKAFAFTSTVTTPSAFSFVGCVPAVTVNGACCWPGNTGSAASVTFCLSALTHVTFTGSVSFSPCFRKIGPLTFSSLPPAFTAAAAGSAASLKNAFSGRTAMTSDCARRPSVGVLLPGCTPHVTVAGRASRTSCLPSTVAVAFTLISATAGAAPAATFSTSTPQRAPPPTVVPFVVTPAGSPSAVTATSPVNPSIRWTNTSTASLPSCRPADPAW